MPGEILVSRTWMWDVAGCVLCVCEDTGRSHTEAISGLASVDGSMRGLPRGARRPWRQVVLVPLHSRRCRSTSSRSTASWCRTSSTTRSIAAPWRPARDRAAPQESRAVPSASRARWCSTCCVVWRSISRRDIVWRACPPGAVPTPSAATSPRYVTAASFRVPRTVESRPPGCGCSFSIVHHMRQILEITAAGEHPHERMSCDPTCRDVARGSLPSSPTSAGLRIEGAPVTASPHDRRPPASTPAGVQRVGRRPVPDAVYGFPSWLVTFVRHRHFAAA